MGQSLQRLERDILELDGHRPPDVQLHGTGTVTMNGNSGGLNEAYLSQSGAAHTVTVDTGITVAAGGLLNRVGGSGTWVNKGTFRASGANRGFSFVSGGTYQNEGVWEADNGGTIGLGGNWTSTGLIRNTGGTFSSSRQFRPTDCS